MSINGTLIWYATICDRQVWYIAHAIEADQFDENLRLGKEIHQLFYKDQKRELLIDNQIKIDLLKNKVVAEIKKSSHTIESARLQLGFYLYYLKQKGVEVDGEILIPKERKRLKVILNETLEKKLQALIAKIYTIAALDRPPKAQKIAFCRRCAYKEYCWA